MSNDMAPPKKRNLFSRLFLSAEEPRLRAGRLVVIWSSSMAIVNCVSSDLHLKTEE